MDLIQKYRGAGEQQARRSTGWAAPPGRKTKIARQGQDARHGGRAAQALRRSARWPRASPSRPTPTGSASSKTPSNITETKDQLSAVKEIKRDMERPQPMDRLLCGDVGFGKTEVAMRAAFKALGDGKQVAVLAPTTVLCVPAFRDVQAPLRARSRCASRCSAGSARRRRSKAVARGARTTAKSISSIGTHRLLVEGRRVQRSGPAGRGRRAALRRPAQGAAEADAQERRRAHHDRDADSAHAAHVAAGPARYVA